MNLFLFEHFFYFSLRLLHHFPFEGNFLFLGGAGSSAEVHVFHMCGPLAQGSHPTSDTRVQAEAVE